MAESEDNPACDLRNAQIDAGTLMFEIRTVLEALSHGIKLLLKKHQEDPVKSELLVLESFAGHAVEAMGSLDEQMAILLGCPSAPVPEA